jgi:hypothetical protein
MLRLVSGVRVCERGPMQRPEGQYIAQTPNLKFMFGPEMEIL